MEGPRAVSVLDPKFLRSYENGVWLCIEHADFVDSDEERFPPDLLHAYRRAAERDADVSAAGGTSARGFTLIPHRTELPPATPSDPTLDPALRLAVDKFLGDVGAETAWGHQVRHNAFVLLTELLLNALTHGTATRAVISAQTNSVSIYFEADTFTLGQLESATPGGARFALDEVRRDATRHLQVSQRSLPNGSSWTLEYPHAEPSTDDPCTVDARRDVAPRSGAVISDIAGCSIVSVYVDPYLMYSDKSRVLPTVLKVRATGPKVVVRGHRGQRAVLAKILGDFLDDDDVSIALPGE